MDGVSSFESPSVVSGGMRCVLGPSTAEGAAGCRDLRDSEQRMIRLTLLGMRAVSSDQGICAESVEEDTERDGDRYHVEYEVGPLAQLVKSEEGENHRGQAGVVRTNR